MDDRSCSDLSLEIRALGGLSISLAGRPVGGLATRKAEALLLYLVYTRRPHPREVLAELFWPERDQVQAQSNLRVALTRLRGPLAPYLDITRQTVACGLQQCDVWLDAHTLETEIRAARQAWRAGKALSAAELEALERALVLYDGDFLAGVSLRDSPAFEEWAVIERERLRNLTIAALDHLTAGDLARGDVTAGQAHANALLRLDPAREETHAQLMLLLARAGQRGAALAQYERCREVLRVELGVEPAAETAALYERIRSGQEGRGDGAAVDLASPGVARPDASSTLSEPLAMPGPASHSRPDRPPADLPPQTTPFVGREAELAAIADLMAQPDCRLLTLTGPGGIGKTRLAVEAARANARSFAGGAVFVPLAAVSSPGFLVSAIASALGLRLQAQSDPQAQLLDFLADRQLLLVLDNFEQVIQGAPLLPAILDAASGVRILVTSRARLDLAAEWLYPLAGLPYPSGDVDAEPLHTFAAFRLFLQSARRVRADLALSSEDEAAVARLCRLVEGLPLAIDLAAAWVRVLCPDEIVAEIASRFDALVGSARDLPERHRSLRTVFDHSYELLKPEEQGVFRKLSVFRGGFTREAAERVAGASLQALASLADQSLVQRSGVSRYDLHELLGQYAGEKLAEAGETEPVRACHLQYIVAFAEAASAGLAGAGQLAWLAKLEAERDNVRAALSWALDAGRVVEAQRIVGSVRKLWHSSDPDEGRAWAEAALELDRRSAGGVSDEQPIRKPAPEPVEGVEGRCSGGFEVNGEDPDGKQRREARAGALLAASELAVSQGDFAAAVAWSDEAASIYRHLGDNVRLAQALSDLGCAAEWGQGDYVRARALQEESVRLLRVTGETLRLAMTLNALAGALFGLGEIEAARTTFEETVSLLEGLGEKGRLTWPLLGLGAIGLRTGAYDRAEFHYERSLAISREVGDTKHAAWSLALLGNVALAQRDPALAGSRYREALSAIGPRGWRIVLYDCFMGLAACAALQGLTERAARLFGAASGLRPYVPVRSEGYRAAEEALLLARSGLGEIAFSALAEATRSRPLPDLFSYALSEPD